MSNTKEKLLVCIIAVLFLLPVGVISSASFNPGPAKATIESDVAVDTEIRINGYWFDPLKDNVPTALRYAEPTGYYLVQLNQLMQPKYVDEIRNAGAEVLGYYPYTTLFVFMSESVKEEVASMSFIRWIGIYEPGYKMASSLKSHLGSSRGTVTLALWLDEQTRTDIMTAPLRNEIQKKFTDVRLEKWVRERNLKHLYGDDFSVAVGAFSLATGNKNMIEPESHLAYMDSKAIEPIKYKLMTTKNLNVVSVADKVASFGGSIKDVRDNALIVEIDSSMIDELAYLPEVYWLEEYSLPKPCMNIVRQYTGVEYVNAQTPPINGSGHLTGHYEYTFDTTHPELEGQVVEIVGALYDPSSPDYLNHGTATLGIQVAKGIDPNAKGMFWGGKAVFVCAYSYTDSGAIAQLASRNVPTMSCSLGGGEFDAVYDSTSSSIDTAVKSNIYVLPFYANGGIGLTPGHSSSSQATAKNVIAAGGIEDMGTISRTDDYYSSGTACWGYTADGRIKPDLCGPFSGVYTIDGTGSDGYVSGDYYSSFGGTSAATPVCTGACALAAQMYKQNLFGNNPTGEKPTAAMLKALMIADAYQLGTADALDNASGTGRTQQGWGEPDLQYMYDLARNHLLVDEYNALSTGMSESFTVLPTGVTPLKISLVWTDPAASAGASPALVNDLDLEVTQGGTTWYGNYGLHTNKWSSSGGTKDSLNNVENVFIQSPSGSYTITVKYTSGSSSQKYALVASGLYGPPCPIYWANRTAEGYISTKQPVIRVGDSNLTGVPLDPTVKENLTVRVYSDTDPRGINVTLIETAVDSKLFEARINLILEGRSREKPDYLRVTELDKVTAEYLDLAPIVQTTRTTAIFESEPPRVYDVQVEEIGKQRFRITYRTDKPATTLVYLSERLEDISCDTVDKNYTYEDTEYAYDHKLSLYGFNTSRTYYFKVGGEDMAGLYGEDNNDGKFYRFTTRKPQNASLLVVIDNDYSYIAQDLTSMDIAYDVYYTNKSGAPANLNVGMSPFGSQWDGTHGTPNFTGQPYKMVLWLTAQSTQSLNASERTCINNYMATADPHIFYMGWDIGRDAYTLETILDPNDDTFSSWYNENLYATYLADSVLNESDPWDYGGDMGWLYSLIVHPIPGSAYEGTIPPDDHTLPNPYDLNGANEFFDIAMYADNIDIAQGGRAIYKRHGVALNPAQNPKYGFVDSNGSKVCYYTNDYLFSYTAYFYTGYPYFYYEGYSWDPTDALDHQIILKNWTNYCLGITSNWPFGDKSTTVSGFVKNQYGDHVSGILMNTVVHAYNSTADPEHTMPVAATVVRDSYGFYNLTLPGGGSYDIYAYTVGYWGNNYTSNPVTIATDNHANWTNITLYSKSIQGTVLNASSGLPIPNADVKAYFANTTDVARATKTDSNGKYYLTGILSDVYDVSAGCSGYVIEKKLNVCFNYESNITVDFKLNSTTIRILYYDDDDGSNWDTVIYEPVLDALGLAYDNYDGGVQNAETDGISSIDTAKYDLVIWTHGGAYDTYTITSTEDTAFRNFVTGANQPNHVLLIGMDTMYNSAQKPAPGKLVYDIFQVATQTDDSGMPNPWTGVPGTFMEGCSYDMTNPYGLSDYTDNMTVRDTPGAYGVMNAKTDFNVIAYNGSAEGYKTIISCCELGFIDNGDGILINDMPQMQDCLARFIDWFEITPPVSPTGFNGYIQGNNVNLTWMPSASPSTLGYRIYRSTNPINASNIDELTPIATVTGKASNYYIDTGAAGNDTNTYYYVVRAYNNYGSDTNTWNVVKLARSLSPGWRLISLPLIQNNISLAYRLASIEGSYDSVRVFWSFDEDNPWKTYNVTRASIRSWMNDMDKVYVDEGVWVRMNTADVLQVVGAEYQGISLSLSKGWNLISYLSMTNRTISDAFKGTEVTRVEVSADDGTTTMAVDSGTGVMRAGYGYWVYAKTDTVWSLPPTGAAPALETSAPSQQSPKMPMERWKQATIGADTNLQGSRITAEINGTIFGEEWCYDGNWYSVDISADDSVNVMKYGGTDGDPVFFSITNLTTGARYFSDEVGTFASGGVTYADLTFSPPSKSLQPDGKLKINELVLTPGDFGKDYLYLWNPDGVDVSSYYLRSSVGWTVTLSANTNTSIYVNLTAQNDMLNNSAGDVELIWDNTGGAAGGNDIVVDRSEWGEVGINPEPGETIMPNAELPTHANWAIRRDDDYFANWSHNWNTYENGTDTDDCLIDFGEAPATARGAAAVTPHAPIYINGNSQFTSANGVSSGSGTAVDPYIIENWDIDASSANGIEILNTNAYFILRNCVIRDGETNYNFGIHFYSVTNGKIENCTIYNNSLGIYLSSSSNSNIINCSVYDNPCGIYLNSSPNNILINCAIYNNYGDGVYLYNSSNNSIINCACLQQFYGVSLEISSNNQITNCDIYNNLCDGIWLYYSTNNQIHYCDIYNNSFYEVHNYNIGSQYSVNATYTWWGSANGPGQNGANGIYGTVIYDPWLIESYHPPFITITQPAEGLITNQNVTLEYMIDVPLTSTGNPIEINIDGPPNGTIYTSEGEYHITITVTDGAGSTATTTLSFTIDKTDPIITVTGVADSAHYNVNVTPVITMDEAGILEIRLNDVYFESDTEISVEGVYYLNVTATDLAGNTATKNIVFTVDKTPPVANASSDREVNEDVSVELNASLSGDNIGIINWTWSFVDQGVENVLYGKVVYYTFTQPGIYVITLNVSDSAGNRALDVVNVTVKDVTGPTVNAGNDVTVNEDVEVELNASLSLDNVGIVNWTWSFVDQGREVFLYGKTVYYTFAQPGYYEITLNVSDASGNRAIDVVNITVKDITGPVISTIQVLLVWEAESGWMNITCVVNDNVGVNIVKVNISSPAGFILVNITMARVAGTNTYYYNTTYPIAGLCSYYICIWANDMSDNAMSSVGYVTFPDITKPVISNIRATPSPQEVLNYVNITANVTDNYQLSDVKVNISGVGNFTMSYDPITGLYYYNISYAMIGIYSFTIWANDSSNNGNLSTVYKFTIRDTTKPEILNIEALPTHQDVHGYVNITCTVTDNVAVDKVYVSITGPAGFTPINITMTKIQDTNNYYYNSTYSIAGDYSYYIWGNDTSNNANKSITYYLNITAPPTPTLISLTEFVEGKEVSITGICTGTINVTSTALPQTPPQNLQSIGIQVNVIITGELTYANITIKYNDSDVANIDETKLRMYYWVGSQWQLCNNTGVDTVNNVVWANVTHLTIFAPMAERAIPGIMETPPKVPNLYSLSVLAIIAIIAICLTLIIERKQKKLSIS